jgi:hypothetical protein
LLVAVGLMGAVSVGMMAFWLQTQKAANFSEQHVRLLGEMRGLTNELFSTASRAHEIVLYRSSDAADRNEADDRFEIVNDEDTGAVSCPVGNFVVFVYYELPKPNAQPRYRIAKLIGYSLDRIGSAPGQLTRVLIDLTGAPSTGTVEEILAAHWDDAEMRSYSSPVSPLALPDGSGEGTVPCLFYKRSERNLAICGQLLQNAANRDTASRETMTRTLFFTVTTRS